MGTEARSLYLILSAQTAGFRGQMVGAGQTVRQFGSNVLSMSDDAVRGLSTIGSQAGKMALITGGALVAAGAAALAWESDWAGVAKTVDGTEAQLADLEDGLRQLARTMPASHSAIAATAEAAGQLGVATEDIVEFTRTMVQLGETTNLTADSAATAIAQLMDVMRSAPDDVDEIGNTLVALGNSGASTEAQIMDLAQRLSGAGQLMGASEADVLGLASALANLGIEAELGGGAVQRVWLKINSAVLGGGHKLDAFARLAGTSAEDFATSWQGEPVAAFDSLLQGLGGVQERGGDVAQTLAALGISGTQNLQVMMRLAGAGDELTKSLAQSGAAWDQNSALLEEYAKRAATTESQVTVAWNNVKDAGIDAGEQLLPILAQIANGTSTVAGAFGRLPSPVTGALSSLLAVATVLGGGLFVTSKAIGSLRTTHEALTALGISGDKATKSMGRLAKAGVGLAGLAAAAGAIRAIQEATDEALPGVDSLALRLLELRNGDVSDLGAEFDSLGESIRRISEKTGEEGLFDAIQTPFTPLVGEAGTLRQARAEIDALDQALASLVQQGSPEVAAESLAAIANSAGLTSSQINQLTDLLPGYRDAVAGVAAQQLLAGDSGGRAASGLEQLLGPLGPAEDGMRDLGGAASYTDAQLKDLVDSFNVLDGILGNRQSLIDYERALDDLAESLKQGGSFDVGTEQGRANLEGLNRIAETAAKRAQALTEARDFDGSNRVLKRAIGDLRGFGQESDAARRAVRPLIDELRSLAQQKPKPTVDANTAPAERKIDDLDGYFDELVGRPYRADVGVEDHATGPLDWITGRLNAIDGRHATATVSIITNHSDTYGGQAGGGGHEAPGSAGPPGTPQPKLQTPGNDRRQVPGTSGRHGEAAPGFERFGGGRFGQGDGRRGGQMNVVVQTRTPERLTLELEDGTQLSGYVRGHAGDVALQVVDAHASSADSTNRQGWE